MAIDEASRLATEDPSVENVFALSQLHFSMGDYRRLCVTAEKLASAEGVSVGRLLRLAWQTQWEDRSLARRLWRRAVGGALADDEVVPVLTLGYALGLDDELKPLQARMAELGAEGKAGIQIATFDDIKGFAEAFQKRAQELGGAYDRAQVPIHMIATPLNLTLAQIYHQYLTDTGRASFSWPQPCIWARHARRPLPEVRLGALPKWRLTLDVTSVLLAQHFQFLDHVENTFAPLRISPGLIPSLILMQDRLTANQPQRLAAYASVIRLVDEGRVLIAEERPTSKGALCEGVRREWLALVEDAADSGGLVVDFVPPIRDDGALPHPEAAGAVRMSLHR